MKKISFGQKESSWPKTFELSLEKAIMDLTFMSETDAEIHPFFVANELPEMPVSLLLTTVGRPSDSQVDQRGFDEFFDRLTRVYENSNEAAKAAAAGFAELRELLRSNLTGLCVFKFGSIRLDVLIVGFDPEGNVRGIRTTAVET